MKSLDTLRICHIILSRGFSGSERSTVESCNQQAKNHHVTLIVKRNHKKNNSTILDYLDQSVSVVEVPALFFTGKAISRALNSIRPDVIHCHLRRATRIIARLSPNYAAVSTLHIKVNSSHFMKMDGIICNAKWQLEAMPNAYKGLVHKAHNSLVPHRRLNEEEKSSLRHQLGVSHKDLLIGAVGRFSSTKAWDTLIKAYSAVTSKKSAKLIFFGSGHLEAQLKRLAKPEPSIVFAGYHENIKDIYQVLDLLVCPSRFEPLPRVMLEGYDAGVPIIASDSGGCKELIEEYGGEMFETDNIDQLSQLLQQFINAPTSEHRPNLSNHYAENTNSEIVVFYKKCINWKLRHRPTA